METTPDPVRARAVRLRRTPTVAERAFWEQVRDRRLDGLKFRRQVVVGRFVVDFVCFEARLVVEIDGGVHKLREAQDAERDAALRAEGFQVVRLGNHTVEFAPETAKALVRHALRSPVLR